MPPVNSKVKKSGAEYENIIAKKCTALDFEQYIQDNKTLLLNDPLRDILLYPTDDVSSVVLPRRWRTVTTAVPDVRTAATCPLLTRQALLSYASSWNLIHYKFSNYSGTYLNLPRPIENKFPEEVYDIDAETESDNETQAAKLDLGTKEGHLLKGPEIGSDRIFSNLASKSFKKRYCSMLREADGTYILEVYKDEKKIDTKLTIVMDFCSDVVRNPKRGKYCFELRMSGGKGYTFAAENEDEVTEWINAFKAALKKSQDSQETHQSDEALDKDADVSLTAEPPPATYGTLKGLEHSMNPLLMRYSRETDMSIAAARNECRYNIFSMPYKRAPSPEPQLEPFKEHFGQRILLKCESLKFRLQAPIDGDKELLCQVEPYYTYLALYDARSGRKLTENFHFDLNHDAVKDLVKETECTKSLVENFSYDVKLDVNQIPEEWFRSKRQVMLSVNNPHPDLFLVVKIDKILQGHVSQVLEPYLKATKDPRLGLKVHKTVQAYANRVGTYRMPFAWAAKPLYKMYSNDLDLTPEFPTIYRQEPNKMSDDDLLKILSDYRKSEKMAKLTVIPGWLSINIQQSNEQVPNCMSNSYAALKPFPLPPAMPLTVELATLNVEPEQPYAAYIHHLYVRPLSLNFESQKMFARARNIACSVELRDNDTGDNKALQAVYGRFGMTSQYRCSVLHHNANPSWSDEAKIRLPATLTPQHHLLFTFHHISCDLAKKNDTNVETCIGYAWVPLIKNDKLADEIVNLPIATHLPSGYLSIQPLGLGRGNAGPEVVWVEGEKQLFRCQLVLDSTVATRDVHLHNLFNQAERLIKSSSPPTSPSPPPWNDVCNALKAAHAIKLNSLVAFLPTILNQLFELMTVEKSYTQDMGYQIVKLIVHFVHMIHDYGRKDLLDSYVKYVFNCVEFKLHTMLTAPLHMFVDPNQPDFLLGNKFMQYSGFFFDIITKSMAQYLINTGRIKMSRHERFHGDLLENIEKLVSTVEPSYILQQPMQTHIFNKNLATFLKSCLSFMDRGFVFRQIKKYLDKFKACDPKALFDFKFTFLQTICSHEHFVPFNLPLHANKLSKDGDEDPAQLKLCEEFIMRHFLAGTLLNQVEQSLREAPLKRKAALSVLRALLTKHEHDDRYRSRQCRARLAYLYSPWLTIVLENAHRLITKSLASPLVENGHDKVDGDATVNPVLNSTKEAASANSTPRRNRLTLHFEHTPVRNSAHFKEPPSIPLNNMYGKDQASNVSQSSLESVSTMSGGDSLPRNMGRLDLSEIGDQVNRFGVMSAEEVRDVLLCFLFVLKYLDDERLVDWWKSLSQAQQQSFFNVLEICAEQFQYIGRKKILSEMKATTPECNGKPKPIKARTLPARMSPPDFSKEPPIVVEKNNTVNRENLVNPSVTTELEAIAEHTVLSASFLATEVGLILIDRSCLFMKNLGAADGVAAKPYLKLLQYPQSETLYKHLFAALRAYINQFSETLFEGGSTVCSGVVAAVVRLCEARAAWLRREAAAALYLLMRANFQHATGGDLTRVHLQVPSILLCTSPGGSTVCSGVVAAVVRLCEARAAWLRREAAAALYLLMRANFQHATGGDLTRVHLQVPSILLCTSPGGSTVCSGVVAAVVRLCEARAAWLRREAAAALYLLMRANFQHATGGDLTRVHLQVPSILLCTSPGGSTVCSGVVAAVVRLCEARAAWLRREAAAALYLLMRANFQHATGGDLTRVHLQVPSILLCTSPGGSTVCSGVVAAVVRLCEARAAWLRREAAAALYLLMRANFQHATGGDLTRVHLQVPSILLCTSPGGSTVCSGVVAAVVRLCEARAAWLRREAAAALYLLMRANFQHATGGDLTRVHLQVPSILLCTSPGGSTVCSGVVAAVVRLCEARAAWLRREAAAALYLLMRANFQHATGGDLTRVHLQVPSILLCTSPGGSTVCSGVVAAVVRLCEARAAWLRREAAAALYLLMRANFQHATGGDLTRVHLQVPSILLCTSPGGSTVCSGVVAAVVRLCEARAAWLRREAAAALYLLMRANFQHATGGDLTRVHLQVPSILLCTSPGGSTVCSGVVAAVVRLCEARAAWLRREAAAALYLLMRANFQHATGGDLTRVHLQVIMAVSKLLDNSTALNCKRFQESLSVINCFATGDKAMKGTGLSSEVAELMRRVRTVVGARARLAGVGGVGASGAGSVQLAELQHALAASCRATPRLRHAWLSNLAEHNARQGDYDEAMCCQLHIAALIAEYLKLRGTQQWGADEFAEISLNIPRDETGLKIDEGMTDVHYNEQALLDQLMVCTEAVDKAERYELLGPLYRLIIPIYERRKDYQALLTCYQHLTKAYAKVIEVTNSGKRLLGRFYRVAFFGKAHFGEDEEGIEFIYKEPKLTSLSEISEKLQNFYEQKFGPGNVKMIMDSAPVNRDELDSKLAYIQVTWVRSAGEGVAAAGSGQGSFERAHNVRRFVYETPFTRDGAARGPVHHQRLRLSHLTAESWFPYVKRRVPVIDTQVEEKSPIEVAVSEMETQVTELTEIVNAKAPDIKKLQLRLQGSICVQVNAGPLAYANAFLDPTLSPMYPDDMVDKLKAIFKEFLTVCHAALQLNAKLISSDQVSYHEALETNYYKLSHSLSGMLGQDLHDILVNGNLSTTVTGVELESSNA